MKYLYVIVASLLLISCNDSESNSNSDALTKEKLVGTWVVKMIDDVEVSTNENFVCRYNANGVEDYYCITASNNGSFELTYTDNSNYTVSNSRIYMNSDIVEMIFVGTISSGELCGELGDILTYTEEVNIQSGVDVCDGHKYVGIRTTVDYTEDIIGLWEGSVIDGDINEPYDNIRLEFKADNKYDFYCPDGSGGWTLLEQNNIYIVMGNILGTEWSESENSTAAEFWETNIDGDNMTWRATRTGIDAEAGFNLTKVVE